MIHLFSKDTAVLALVSAAAALGAVESELVFSHLFWANYVCSSLLSPRSQGPVFASWGKETPLLQRASLVRGQCRPYPQCSPQTQLTSRRIYISLGRWLAH